jgi:NAD+ diphosphatase
MSPGRRDATRSLPASWKKARPRSRRCCAKSGEELGLTARLNGFIGCYPFYPQNQLILAYDVEAEGQVVLNHELADYRIIAADKLRPWEFGTGLAVRDWLAARARLLCPNG